MSNIFEKSDVRETPDLWNGFPINVSSTITGEVVTNTTLYTVPVGRKLLLQSIVCTKNSGLDTADSDLCYSRIIIYDSSVDEIFYVRFVDAYVKNFLGTAPIILGSGCSIVHSYLGDDNTDYNTFAISGVEIDER